MDWSPISKPRTSSRREPCLTDYDKARREFTWEQAGALLDGLPGGALNIAHEAVDRHAQGLARDRSAIRFLAQGAAPHDLTYRRSPQPRTVLQTCWQASGYSGANAWRR